MAFRAANLDRLAKFNSSTSMKFLEMYEAFLDDDVAEENSRPSSRNIAPSSLRCLRKTWFRLKGTTPDKPKSSDRGLSFTATVGIACHEDIQRRLIKHIDKSGWVDIPKYMEEHVLDHTYTLTTSGYETQVQLTDIPMRFAVDGIVKIDDIYYLLEIKSSEYSAWDELTDPKEHHKDQAICYATILGLDGVLFLYVDRLYGGLKCFEMTVKQYEKDKLLSNIQYVLDCVESGLAPEALPKGDSECSRAMCPYFDSCSQYGR